MTQTKHTATPWKAYENEITSTFPIAMCQSDVRGLKEAKANAEFIVRAVNSHADLVKGAQIVVEYFSRGVKKSPELEKAFVYLSNGLAETLKQGVQTT